MIETVLGPIAAGDLGVACMHDHVLADASSLYRAGSTPAPTLDRVTPANLSYLKWNALASADNLRLDDAQVAVDELRVAYGHGLRAVVECSSWGLGPSHAGLPEISAASGLAIIAAYGAYIPRTVPGWIAAMTESQLEAHLFDALTVAIAGTSFRAGMLGIMGTTGALEQREREQLRAAARAASRAGASVSVRLDPDARNGLAVLDLVADEGLARERVVFTNADEFMDDAYWSDLSAAGAVLEMCFGTEAVHDGRMDNPSDRERLSFFSDFVQQHPNAALVLGESVWTKIQLRAFGGHGYGYLLERIAPALLSRGVEQAQLSRMLQEEPRRLLDR